jgi:hypothetical protein
VEHPQEILDILRRIDESVAFAQEIKGNILSVLSVIDVEEKLGVSEALEINEHLTSAAQCAAGLGTLVGIMKSYIDAFIEAMEKKNNLKGALGLAFDENSILRRVDRASSEAKGLIILLAAGRMQMDKIDFSGLLPK